MNISNQTTDQLKQMINLIRSAKKEDVINPLIIFISQAYCIAPIRDMINNVYSPGDVIIYLNLIRSIFIQHYDELVSIGTEYMLYLYDDENNNNYNDIRYKNMLKLISKMLNAYIKNYRIFSSEAKYKSSYKAWKSSIPSKKPMFTLISNVMIQRQVNVTCNYDWEIMQTSVSDVINFITHTNNVTDCISLLLKITKLFEYLTAIYTDKYNIESEILKKGTNTFKIKSRKIDKHLNHYPKQFVEFNNYAIRDEFTEVINSYLPSINEILTFKNDGPNKDKNLNMLLFILTSMYMTKNNDFINMCKVGYYNLDAVNIIFNYLLENSDFYTKLFNIFSNTN